MTAGEYTITSGIAGPTEQDTLDLLDQFMVGGLGWHRIDIVTDTASDNDRVWYSEGEVPGKYNPMYVRIRANNNDLVFYGYTQWVISSGTGNDEIADGTNLQITNDNAADEYVFAGNKDVVFVATRLNSDGSTRFGGAGYWDTFYEPTEDPYPLWVMGQNAAATTFESDQRVRSYGYDKDGFLNTTSTVSGGSVGYVAENLNFLTSLATPNPRDNRHLMLKSPFYRERSRTDGDIAGALSHEVRGEIPGLYQFSGTNFVSFDRIVASGISAGDQVSGDNIGEGDFIVLRGTSSNAYTLGPLSDYSPFAPELTTSSIELWLDAEYVQKRPPEAKVSHWIDLSENLNEVTQSTEADQPFAVTSGTLNNNPIIRFDDSDHMSGSVTIPNDITVFVVGSYDIGSDRQPLFYIRGDISGNDYILAMEFNTTDSDTAYVTAQDTSSSSDVIKYSGLSSGQLYILSAVISGNDTTFYVNGDSSNSTTVTNTKGTVVGNNTLNFGVGTTLDVSGSVDATARHDGDLAKIIVVSEALSTDDHQAVICDLSTQYGITVSGTCV